MKVQAARAGLVGQQQALDAYFDALFGCETTAPGAAMVPPTELPPEVRPSADVAADSLRFQLFNVTGLTFAIPMERVTVVEGSADFIDAPVSPSPCVGTLTWNDRQVPVVDTARLVLPEERAATLCGDTAERCRVLLIIGDGRYALGCSGVAEVVELTDAEINWRTSAGKRPWLAGMAAQRRCALLDVDGLIRLLDSSMA